MARQETKWIASDNTAWDTEEEADRQDMSIAFRAVCDEIRAAGVPISVIVEDAVFAGVLASLDLVLDLRKRA